MSGLLTLQKRLVGNWKSLRWMVGHSSASAPSNRGKNEESVQGYISSDDEIKFEGPPPDPPNPMLAISAMGIGAFFAIGIAAMGIYSSFYLAAWTVANSSRFPKIERTERNENDSELRTFIREKLGLKDDDASDASSETRRQQ